MRIILFIILFGFSSSYSYCQEWKRTYGYGYIGRNIIESYDKGFIITAKKGDPKYIWIIKTDINGNILWNKYMTLGQYIFSATNSELSSDKGLIIGCNTTKVNNQHDAMIIKLNPCGDLQWCKILYTPWVSDDSGMKIKSTADNGCLLLGFANDPNQTYQINLYKVDSIGNLVWHKAYAPDSLLFGEVGQDIFVTTDAILITGDGYYPSPGQPGGWIRPYFIKTDAAGNDTWKLVYGVNNFYIGDEKTTVESPNHDYYSVGRNLGYQTGMAASLIKVLGSGAGSYQHNLIDSTVLGGATTINLLNDTTLIIGAAWAYNEIGGPMGLLKTDTLGLIKKIKILNPYTGNTLASTVKTLDDKFISIASQAPGGVWEIYAYKVNADLEYDSIYNQPFVYDSLCPYPIISDTIVPDCDIIVNVEEPFSNPESHKLKVFPNPAASSVMVVFPKYLIRQNHMPGMMATTVYHQWTSTRLEIYDLKGSHLLSKEIPKNMEQLEMDISSWPPGMYYFRLVYKNETVAGEKVIKQ
jgi:hypothetical protein